MKTWIFAGAFALAAMGSLAVNCNSASAATIESNKLTEVNIAQIKGLLKLSPAQEPLWARIEAVLISVAREQAQEDSSLLRRLSRRAVMIAFNNVVADRIKSAAMPLLASLNDEQRLTVRAVAQRMGITQVASMVN